jgi:hypothetical protein
MQVLCKGPELGLGKLLLILFSLLCLGCSKLFKFCLELLVFCLKGLQLRFSHVKVVDVFSYKITPENLLNNDGLLCKIL